jgi:hypothetical protein
MQFVKPGLPRLHKYSETGSNRERLSLISRPRTLLPQVPGFVLIVTLLIEPVNLLLSSV